MRNFNYPYFSRDIAEFWRRWHISLTTWFRDYIYIPLGGSRTTKAKVIRNTFIIFLVSGFWHGANWTFIAWGAYHALLFLPLILLGKNRKYTNVVASEGDVPMARLYKHGTTETQHEACDHKKVVSTNESEVKLRLFPSLREAGQMLCTFFLAVIGWIIFRIESISDFIPYLQGMWQWGTLRASYRFFTQEDVYITGWLIVLMLVVEWLQRNKQHGLEMQPKPWYIRYPIYAIMVFLILLFYGDNETFIYFQF